MDYLHTANIMAELECESDDDTFDEKSCFRLKVMISDLLFAYLRFILSVSGLPVHFSEILMQN